MKIGIVGYQGSGKSTLFQWLTGVKPDLAQAHVGQMAMSAIPDDRVEKLVAIYKPKKITLASLELLDTPGLNRTHEGNAQRLAVLREAGALVLVVAGFGGRNPKDDLASFEEDLLLADMEIVTNRVARLQEILKKPRPAKEREADQAELAALEPLLASLESGKALRDLTLTDDQLKATRSFRLLTEKPRLIVVNTADSEQDLDRYRRDVPAGERVVVTPVALQLELTAMAPEEREEFLADMPKGVVNRDDLLRTILDVSGQMLYFTAGEKEVRTWLLRKGGVALEAADNIHSDLARGFIRAEVMHCDDLIRLGSEREVKANNLMRQEPRDYVVKDGDILHVRFSV